MKTIIAYSDCLEVYDGDVPTLLIRYTNKSNFADVSYSHSPRPVFEIRVQASHFHEKFVETNEGEELSDGTVVKISGSVKKRRELLIEPIPYYLAFILKLAMMHNYLEVDGVRYEKEEAAEVKILNVKYPLCVFEVDLTQKDESFYFNVYGKI